MEFSGNTIVVNGRTWPVLEVEPRRYRFRLLNGCNARTLMLKLVNDALAKRSAVPALSFWQIGNDGGFLPAVTNTPELLVAPAQRADVVVDFSNLAPGTEVYLINEGPDLSFAGGVIEEDYQAADPATSGQVMKLQVLELTAPDTSADPATLTLPALPLSGPESWTRQLSLNELDSAVLPGIGPRIDLLGVVDTNGPVPMM